MAKQSYEFDYIRDAGLVQADIEAAVATYNNEQSINIQVHGLPAPKSNRLLLGFLTFANNLAQEHKDWVNTMLTSIEGLIGYTPPVPPPPAILELDATAGLAAAGATFPAATPSCYVQAEWYDPNTGIGVTAGQLDGTGYTAGIANPDPQVFTQISLEMKNVHASLPMEFAADTLILKDVGGTEFALDHPKMTLNKAAIGRNYSRQYILGIQLYVFQEVFDGTTTIVRKTPEQAVDLPQNPLSSDYAVGTA